MSKHRKIASRVLRVAAVSGIAMFAVAPTAAHATGTCPYPGTNCPTTPNDPADPVVKGATATKASTLPFTGGDATGLALIGVGAVAAGAVVVRQSRRRVAA